MSTTLLAPPAPAADVELPAEFDPAIYVANERNRDLQFLDAEAARHHYRTYGRKEGRPCSAVDGRAAFLALVPAGGDRLEIGPSSRPCFPRGTPGVRYLDTRGTEQLRAAANGNPDAVPDIDFVSRGRPYRELTQDRFDAIVSSRNLERQPCLVTHLTDVATLLRPGARFFATVTDSRFGSDHYLPDMNLVDVLDAFAGRRTNAAPRDIIARRLLGTHNDAAAHWAGRHGPDPHRKLMQERGTRERIAEVLRALRAGSDDPDTIVWRFSPGGFRDLMEILAATGLSPLRVERLYPTIKPGNEFYAVLSVMP